MVKKQLFEYTIEELEKLVDKALNVDDSSGYALDQEIKTQSKGHSKWIFLAGRAKKFLEDKQLELEYTTAEIAAQIREQAVADGSPLPKTAPVIKEMVPLDQRWQELSKEVIKLNEYVSVLSKLEKTWNNRAFLLIRLARNREAEDLEVKPRTYRRKNIDDVAMKEMDL
ncbi:MAG: hypothetical protein GWN64_08950 [Candidatus Thorarchaeota archaeon]|nr:hypothetical protein [Candidatus Thorarchaeota archaeon]